MNANNNKNTYCFIVEKEYVRQFKQKKFKFMKEIHQKSNVYVCLYSIPNVDFEVCKLSGPDDANIQLALNIINDKIPQVNLESIIFTPSPVNECASNQEVIIRITSFVTPAHFYVQLASYKNYTEVESMNQNLNATYNQQEHFLAEAELKVQKPCAVLHEDNWYRATIVDAGRDIVVRLLDYGNVVTTNINNLRKLLPVFHSLSFQAVECKLENLQSSQGEWSEETLEFMKDIAKKPNKIKIKNLDANGTLIVELFSSHKHSNWTSINATLINRKYACFVMHPLESAGDYEYEVGEQAEAQMEAIHISIGSEFLSEQTYSNCKN